jgi:hypothetical protein
MVTTSGHFLRDLPAFLSTSMSYTHLIVLLFANGNKQTRISHRRFSAIQSIAGGEHRLGLLLFDDFDETVCCRVDLV